MAGRGEVAPPTPRPFVAVTVYHVHSIPTSVLFAMKSNKGLSKEEQKLERVFGGRRSHGEGSELGGCPERVFLGEQMGFWGVKSEVTAAWLGEGGFDEAPTLSPRAGWG